MSAIGRKATPFPHLTSSNNGTKHFIHIKFSTLLLQSVINSQKALIVWKRSSLVICNVPTVAICHWRNSRPGAPSVNNFQFFYVSSKSNSTKSCQFNQPHNKLPCDRFDVEMPSDIASSKNVGWSIVEPLKGSGGGASSGVRGSSSLKWSQWCCLRPSVLGQDRSETKKKSVLVLVFHTAVSFLVLQVWCCVVKHGLVTLVVIHDDLEGDSNFSSTIYSFFILSLEHHYCEDQQWCSLT